MTGTALQQDSAARLSPASALAAEVPCPITLDAVELDSNPRRHDRSQRNHAAFSVRGLYSGRILPKLEVENLCHA